MLRRIIDGRTDLVIDFVETGNLANSQDSNGVSLIKWCAYHGDVSAIRFLLGHGESLQSLGDTRLNDAVFHGYWQLCEFLIEEGAEVNYCQPGTGESPLHAALCKANRPNYELIVELLLNNGADPNVITKPSQNTNMFMRDCRTKAESPLHRAAAFGSERSIQLLLNADADKTVKDLHGDSPLSWASWHLRPAAVLRLLCYDDFNIHPDNDSDYDHGTGWGQMDLKGKISG